MPLSSEDCDYFTNPGVSPFFPELPLRDYRVICRTLQNLGRDPPSTAVEVDFAEDFFADNGARIVFTHTFMQKCMTALRFEWDGHAVTRLSKYYPDVDLTELKPLLWEEVTSDTLIMYHRRDMSFWAYRCSRVDPEFQLVRLGYSWTDVALEYPSLHFSLAEEETKKRRERTEIQKSEKRRKVEKKQDVSGRK